MDDAGAVEGESSVSSMASLADMVDDAWFVVERKRGREVLVGKEEKTSENLKINFVGMSSGHLRS